MNYDKIMIIAIPSIEKTKHIYGISVPNLAGESMKLDEFLLWKQEEDYFSYEWNDGVLEAKETMKQDELELYNKIHRKFVGSTAFQEGFEIVSELECNLLHIGKVRRPDISIVSQEQIRLSKNKNYNLVPFLAIEIISTSNSGIKIEMKMREYFQAGVKTVWHIYRELKEVRVYTSSKQVLICTDSDVCYSGVMDFSLTPEELFE